MTNTSADTPNSIKNITDISGFESTLHDLADRSASVILPFFRTKIAVEEKYEKGIYDPVTAADRQAEQIMREVITKKFPDHGIIGEEFADITPEAEHCWIFDPIDGTRAFIIGAPTWGTLIGLTHNEAPKLGMMNQPFTKERFWGGPAGSFHRHGSQDSQKLSTSNIGELENASLSSTAPEHFSKQSNWQRFQSLSAKSRMTRYGYDCYAYCLLAMGLIDLVAETDLATYDIAPLIPIVRGAGGIITTWDNEDPTKGGTILASANQQLHDKALEVLTQS